MLTPQDIAEKGFNKVLVNGYDMGEVDDFLESVTEDYSALYKENAILKGKLKVLVEKVEEYRTTEDAMRMALLTAQRMGDEITSEATKARDEMLQSTEKEIKEKLTETARQVAEEEMRLVAASKETAKFIELAQAILRKHSEFLKKLETAQRTVKPKKGTPPANPAPPVKATPKQVSPPPPPPPPEEPPPPPPSPKPPKVQEPKQVGNEVDDIEFDSIAEEIGNAVEEIALEGPESIHMHQDDSPTINTPPAAASEPPQSLFADDDDSMKLYSPEDDISVELTSPRPKFDFDDLKFGANFDTED